MKKLRATSEDSRCRYRLWAVRRSDFNPLKKLEAGSGSGFGTRSDKGRLKKKRLFQTRGIWTATRGQGVPPKLCLTSSSDLMIGRTLFAALYWQFKTLRFYFHPSHSRRSNQRVSFWMVEIYSLRRRPRISRRSVQILLQSRQNLASWIQAPTRPSGIGNLNNELCETFPGKWTQ